MYKTIGNDQKMRWMAAACVAAGMMLGGCDAGAESTHATKEAGADAARRTMSAGEPKATDKLYELVASGATGVPTGPLSEYVKTQGVDKDLEAAVGALNGKIGMELDAGVKSALETQLGSVQLELSQARFAQLQTDLTDLTRRAVALANVAQRAVEMGAQAATLEAGSKAPDKTNSDNATAAVAERQSAVAAAQAKVKSIGDQIAAKEAQARKIYADTDAAFQAADSMKGAAGIAAGQKAMDDRKAGDQLTAEIGNLAPELMRAQGELAMAQTALSDVQNLAKSSGETFDASRTAVEKTTQQAKDLRAAAQQVVNDKGGVKEQLAALVELFSKVDGRLKSAVAAADQASASYASAASDLRTAKEDARKTVDDRVLEASDPISKFVKDDRLMSTLMWSQSAAVQQAGHVNLAGAEASDLAGVATKIAADAFRAAGEGTDSQIPANTYRADAAAKFTKAVDIAVASNKMPAPAGSDLEKVRWMGYGLEATAQHGLYLATKDATALSAAKAAQANVAKSNPSASGQLSWLDDVK